MLLIHKEWRLPARCGLSVLHLSKEELEAQETPIPARSKGKGKSKGKAAAVCLAVYDEDSDNDIDANDPNVLEANECTAAHGGSTSPYGMACTPQIGGACRSDRVFFNQFGLTCVPSHEEPVSMPTLHFQDKNGKDMIIELGRTGRYCVLLTADETVSYTHLTLPTIYSV